MLASGVAQAVKSLPSKSEALNSNPSIAKKEKKFQQNKVNKKEESLKMFDATLIFLNTSKKELNWSDFQPSIHKDIFT
jgi:hypothetical protein